MNRDPSRSQRRVMMKLRIVLIGANAAGFDKVSLLDGGILTPPYEVKL